VIRALGVEYRTRADLPKPHHPTCDQCGYDLIMTFSDHACPECGKPVRESLSAAARQPSRWEQNPSLLNPKQLGWQMTTLFRSPMSFFSSIPLRTDHRAARRWLIFSLLVIGLAAGVLGPVISYLGPWLGPLIAGAKNASLTEPDFSFTEWQLYAGSFAIGATWALLALVMVGVETGGMAIIGHMRQYAIDLSCTSKVTSYASIYMLAWVILGSVQILGVYLWMYHPSYRAATERTQILIGFGSAALLHIMGLVVFEWVVYAGLRRIQFSNK